MTASNRVSRWSAVSEKLYRRLAHRKFVREVDRSAIHVSGPQEPSKPGDLVMVCVMFNAELYVRDLIEHHLAMGVDRIVLLDNGSTDQTVPLARACDGVTIFSSELPFIKYTVAFRHWLERRFAPANWVMSIDSDELVDPPIGLPDIKSVLPYLDANGYTAMVGHMLDMFRPAGNRDIDSGTEGRMQSGEWFCAPNATVVSQPIAQFRPGLFNRFADPDLEFILGGVRMDLLGQDVLLSKFPLIRTGNRLSTWGVHKVNRAVVADITCPIRHYILNAQLREKAELAIARGSHFNNSIRYRQILDAFGPDGELAVDAADYVQYTGPDSVAGTPFGRVSGPFLRFFDSG